MTRLCGHSAKKMPVAASIARNAVQTQVAMPNSGKLERFQLVQPRLQRADVTAASCAVLQKIRASSAFLNGTLRE